jgi:peptidoglycan/LPS O-acetylase OafA/YrhL
MAIIYYFFENHNLFRICKSNKIIQYIALILTILVILFGVRYFSPFYNKRLSRVKHTFFAGICWSSLIILFLVGTPNFITKFLSECQFLRFCGKFSFGIYLLNPMILLYFENVKLTTNFELLFIISICSFITGFLFYYLVENNFMKIAEFIIKKIGKELRIKNRFT